MPDIKLPDEVLHRMADAGVSPETRELDGRTLEVVQRSAEDIEITGDESAPVVRGYASVFDFPYDIAGGPEAGGFTEVIRSSAFNRTLSASPDVLLVPFHNPAQAVARTKSGTLELRTDGSGLAWDTPGGLDLANPYAAAMVSGLRRGDADEASFAFGVRADRWNKDFTEREITEVSLNRGDVTVCTWGANPATVSTLLDRSAPTDLVSLEFAQAFMAANGLGHSRQRVTPAMVLRAMSEEQEQATREQIQALLGALLMQETEEYVAGIGGLGPVQDLVGLISSLGWYATDDDYDDELHGEDDAATVGI